MPVSAIHVLTTNGYHYTAFSRHDRICSMTAYGDSLELVVLEGPHVIFADVVSLEMRLVLVAQCPVPVCLGRDEDHENDEDDEGNRVGHDERNLEEAKIGDDEEDEENDDAEDDEPDAPAEGSFATPRSWLWPGAPLCGAFCPHALRPRAHLSPYVPTRQFYQLMRRQRTIHKRMTRHPDTQNGRPRTWRPPV